MSFQVTGLEEFSRKLQELSDSFDDAATKAVEAGGQIVQKELSSAVNAAANRGYATGALAASIKASGVKSTGGGKSVTVAPRGSVKKVRNSDKMFYLEHGTSRQAAHPFMTRTLNTVQPKVVQAMQDAVNASIGGGS